VEIVSWNVNSLRSRASLVEAFLAEVRPDVLALQETKTPDSQVPWKLFADAGYEVAHLGAGSSAGVALASRVGLERVQYGFGGEHGRPFDEPRLVAADCDGLRVVNVYVPNGRTMDSAHWRFKLAWLELLRVELELELAETDELVVVGDFNVCPTPDDLYKPSKRNRNLVSDEERAALAKVFDLGLTDLARATHPDNPGYTWFSFTPGFLEANKGYRLDLALGSDPVRQRTESCEPLLAWRRPRENLTPSDHAPLHLTLR